MLQTPNELQLLECLKYDRILQQDDLIAKLFYT